MSGSVLNLDWLELSVSGTNAAEKLKEEQQKLQERQDLLLRQMQDQQLKLEEQQKRAHDQVEEQRIMEQFRQLMEAQEQQLLEQERLKQLAQLQDQQQQASIAAVQDQALIRNQQLAEQLTKLASEKEQELAMFGSPLGNKLDDWVKNEAFRREKAAKSIDEFLWANAAHMNAEGACCFQKMSAAEKQRVICGGTLAGAWDAAALMRARAKDPNEPDTGNKKRKTNSWDTAPTGPVPHMFFITISEKSVLVDKGLPNCCPVMTFDSTLQVFNSTNGVLSEAVGDITDQILIEDDGNWDRFPEVASVVFQNGGAGSGLAIAIAPGFRKWAVGLHTDPLGRQTAAKLALVVAIAFENPDIVDRLTSKYINFASMWKQVIAGTALDPDAVQAVADQVPQVHLLQLTLEDQLVKEGLAAQGYCVAFSKALKDVFSCAHQLIHLMIGDTGLLELIDDPEWTTMPSIGDAIKRAGADVSSYCIAVCRAKKCWAIGLGYSWKNRQNAAKLAMALVIGATDGKLLEAAEHYPEFCGLCTATGLITPEQAEQAVQRNRMRENMYNQKR